MITQRTSQYMLLYLHARKVKGSSNKTVGATRDQQVTPGLS